MSYTNPAFYRPGTDPLEAIRSAVVEAFSAESIKNKANHVACSAVEDLMKSDDESDTQEYLRKTIGDGIANLREVARSYWELGEYTIPDSVKVIGTSARSYYSQRMSTEISRIMSLVASRADKNGLVPLAECKERLDKMTDAMFVLQNELHAMINDTKVELSRLGGK